MEKTEYEQKSNCKIYSDLNINSALFDTKDVLLRSSLLPIHYSSGIEQQSIQSVDQALHTFFVVPNVRRRSGGAMQCHERNIDTSSR